MHKHDRAVMNLLRGNRVQDNAVNRRIARLIVVTDSYDQPMEQDGGAGSGNWGHKGRIGKRGGSGKGGGRHNRVGSKEEGFSKRTYTKAEMEDPTNVENIFKRANNQGGTFNKQWGWGNKEKFQPKVNPKKPEEPIAPEKGMKHGSWYERMKDDSKSLAAIAYDYREIFGKKIKDHLALSRDPEKMKEYDAMALAIATDPDNYVYSSSLHPIVESIRLKSGSGIPASLLKSGDFRSPNLTQEESERFKEMSYKLYNRTKSMYSMPDMLDYENIANQKMDYSISSVFRDNKERAEFILLMNKYATGQDVTQQVEQARAAMAAAAKAEQEKKNKKAQAKKDKKAAFKAYVKDFKYRLKSDPASCYKPAKISDVPSGPEMDFEAADHRSANPNFKFQRSTKDPSKFVNDGSTPAQFYKNCQTCVVAYELRRRGYDVVATGNTGAATSANRQLSGDVNLAWIDPATGQKAQSETVYARVDEDVYNQLDKKVQPGQRWHLDFGWKESAGAGHIITMERDKNGELMFYDPQCGQSHVGKDAVMKYISRISYDSSRSLWGRGLQIKRVDHLIPYMPMVERVIMGSKAKKRYGENKALEYDERP